VTGRKRESDVRGAASGPPGRRGPRHLDRHSFTQPRRKHRVELDRGWSEHRAPSTGQPATGMEALKRFSAFAGRTLDLGPSLWSRWNGSNLQPPGLQGRRSQISQLSRHPRPTVTIPSLHLVFGLCLAYDPEPCTPCSTAGRTTRLNSMAHSQLVLVLLWFCPCGQP